ncbi:MAG: hypothetical protein K2J85_04840, partial [Anaeroplasmataceae bacterium]|nr:hypothetical protein [Anaeroplasmataceae bacterium]
DMYKEYLKNVKHIGEVYAVITSKGYAIAQIAGINYHGGQICRIFSKLYEEIPTNIDKIISKKEDWLNNIELSSMAHWRVKQAIKIGNYRIPEDFSIPQYYRDCVAFGLGGKPAPFEYWAVRDYKGNILLFKDWILNILHKKITDNSWKKDFLKLNPAYFCNGPALIEKLENGFSLSKWKPTDFDKKINEIIKEVKNTGFLN